MSNRLAWELFGSILGSILLTATSALYMLHLRVPAVMEVRPRLAEVDLLTGLFSGRSMIYLWYHYPDVMVGLELVMFTIIILVTAWGLR